MNAFFGLVLYMLIGGMIAGSVQENRDDVCGSPQPMIEQLNFDAALWPMYFGMFLVLDRDETDQDFTCVTK